MTSVRRWILLVLAVGLFGLPEPTLQAKKKAHPEVIKRSKQAKAFFVKKQYRQAIQELQEAYKIEPDPANPQYIETISGLGYGLTLIE